MVGIAIQLQTIGGLHEDIVSTIATVGETVLEGVEFAGLDGSSPEAVSAALDDAELEAVGGHVRVDRLEEEYEAVVEAYRTIGCRRLIVHSYDRSAFRSSETVADAARRLSTISSRLADDGFELLYHNQTAEFERLETGLAYDSFVEALDGAIDLELDVGLAMHAGIDPIELLGRHRDRTPLVHLTDTVAGGDVTLQVELGAGELDVERCVEAACDAGVEWLIYEHGRTSAPLDSLTHATTKLPALLDERGGPDSSRSVSTLE